MKQLKIVAYGGGVNSTAMLIGLTKREIIVDYIVFSDTGGEKPETYDYIEYFSKWLVKNGQPEIKIVRTLNENGDIMTLEADLLKRGALPPIAYGWKTCSDRWKTRPFNKFVNSVIKKGEKPIKYIGFDFLEGRRVKEDITGKFENQFPLVEWQWDRKKCLESILNEGLCAPPKSSCFFCPNMRKKEILALSPELKQRAIEIEKAAKDSLVELKGLGRNYAWTDLLNSKQTDFFDDLEMFQKPCECID